MERSGTASGTVPQKRSSRICGLKVLPKVWDHFLATESPLKKMKNVFFYFKFKALHSQDIFVFVLTFLVMYKNGFIRKLRLVLKFMMSQPG